MGYQERPADWLVFHCDQIVDAISEGVISTDANTRIVFFNAGAEAMFGYNRNEVMGKPLDILVPEHYRGNHYRYFTKFSAQEESARMIGSRGRVTALRSDYSEFPAEISIARFSVGGSAMFTAVVRDMTARACRAAGLTPYVPQGAYYMLCDVSALGLRDDREAARLILAGKVRTGDRRVEKPGTFLPGDAPLAVAGPSHPFVSRMNAAIKSGYNGAMCALGPVGNA